MIAGGRKERVGIYKLVKEKTSSGSVKNTYVLLKTLSAEISFKTTTEKEINSQVVPLNKIKFKFRFRRDLDETMMIKLWGDMYNIRYIEHNKRIDTFITGERGKQ